MSFKNIPLYQRIFGFSPVLFRNLFATFYAYIVSKRKYGRIYVLWSNILKKSQYFSQDELKKFQLNILNLFLNKVYNSSEYYKKIMDERGINPELISSIEDIRKFPLINKQIVREQYDKIFNNMSGEKLYKFSSSGTTGTSLHIYTNNDTYQREYAFRWHFLSVGGAKRGDRFAFFLGSKVKPVHETAPPYHIIDYYENTIHFSIFHMSDKTLPAYFEELKRFKPDYIKGYPSGLYEMASYMKKTDKRLNIKAVYSASEMLHDYQKSVVEEVFNTTVYQWFGQVETTVNIHECEYRKLHVKEEYGYLELLRDDGTEALPGEVANVIGTGWGNPVFPLIRYDTGDNMILALDQTCPCGRNGRIIEKIIGRDEDVVVTPDGKRIGRLDFVLKPVDSVLEAQIIQEAVDSVKINVVVNSSFSNEDENIIVKKFKDYVGDNINVSVVKVDRIERTPGGKIKYVISKIKK